MPRLVQCLPFVAVPEIRVPHPEVGAQTSGEARPLRVAGDPNAGTLTVQEMIEIADVAGEHWQIPRTNVLTLLCSGVGKAAELAVQYGYGATTSDKKNDKGQDLTILIGVMFALYCVMSTMAGGLCWGSHDCSTWLNFVSRHTYGRDRGEKIYGNETSAKVGPKVREQNDVLVVLCPPT